MTSELPSESVVNASIEGLRLERRFDVVMLMSNLINSLNDNFRRNCLSAARDHMDSSSRALMQRVLPAFISKPFSYDSSIPGVDLWCRVSRARPLHAVFGYRFLDGEEFEQDVELLDWSGSIMEQDLAKCGLTVNRTLENGEFVFLAKK